MDVYLDHLKTYVTPWVMAGYKSTNNAVRLQEGAPAHNAKKTQKFLNYSMPFIKTGEWPPSLPDFSAATGKVEGVQELDRPEGCHHVRVELHC